ncbi:MAG: dockerin type I repeat-containing protein, partial [Clostridia bacterium]|nr:dockerin type I repeat-containing protein [Clostridia bacterium]
DAGETVRLFIALHNKGGVASNVSVSIDTIRSNDPSLTDPYFTIVNSTMQLSDIGTYSVRNSTDYFEIIVSPDCPNDYLADFNIRFTYENGLDETDETVYDGGGKAQFNVSRGYHLPTVITEDTIYTADRLYIVGQDVVIPEGITVTFEAGCEIQFYADGNYDMSPRLLVYGTLNCVGAKGNNINIYPSERYYYCVCIIETGDNGILNIDWATIINAKIVDRNLQQSIISHSNLLVNNLNGCQWEIYGGDGKISQAYNIDNFIGEINNCYIDLQTMYSDFYVGTISDSIVVAPTNYGSTLNANFGATNNIFYSTSGSMYNGVIWRFSGTIQNNMFFSPNDDEPTALLKLAFSHAYCINSSFSVGFQKYASLLIEGYFDSTGTPSVNVYGSLADASLLWPHVVSVEMFDKDGNPITTVGREEIKVRVTFNRPMDVNAGTFLTFGTIEPYADYRIDGEYVSDTVWEGTYTLKAQIENGQNFLKVNNACAAEDQTKTVFGEYHLHEFTIDTTAAMSMNLQANATDKGIELTFVQDDYDTLLGYNIYRSTEKDGNFVRINPTIIPEGETTFLDENAEPGKTYWYTYTVVLTDFTESNPAGKVMATAMDTLAPNMYHTPVNQGYMNNNLVISCTASDNVAISTVTLYYRTVGATDWKTLTMSKQSDKYSATIFGSELTLDGIEYYIVASDGINTINKGSAETPYTVVIKDASAISRKGDVDGDGVVTTKDALMLMQCINGDLLLTDDEFKRADLNGDGVLNSMEALRILQYINGNVNTLEM